MERIKFINHKGAEILLLDFSNCTVQELYPLFVQAKAVITAQPRGSVLTLTDVTNAQVNDTITQQVKTYTIQNKPFVKASAVVGALGMLKVILGTVEFASKREFREFETLEQAKDWLAEQK